MQTSGWAQGETGCKVALFVFGRSQRERWAMIEPTPVRRMLRSRYVFFANDTVWVVDESQPVAALVDPRTGELGGLVSWADLPPAPPGSGQPEIVADATGLWVQNHRDGPLVHVGAEGIDRVEFAEGGRLLCAGPAGAWCLPQVRRRFHSRLSSAASAVTADISGGDPGRRHEPRRGRCCGDRVGRVRRSVTVRRCGTRTLDAGAGPCRIAGSEHRFRAALPVVGAADPARRHDSSEDRTRDPPLPDASVGRIRRRIRRPVVQRGAPAQAGL